jgi:hypothetical protein
MHRVGQGRQEACLGRSTPQMRCSTEDLPADWSPHTTMLGTLMSWLAPGGRVAGGGVCAQWW